MKMKLVWRLHRVTLDGSIDAVESLAPARGIIREAEIDTIFVLSFREVLKETAKEFGSGRAITAFRLARGDHASAEVHDMVDVHFISEGAFDGIGEALAHFDFARSGQGITTDFDGKAFRSLFEVEVNIDLAGLKEGEGGSFGGRFYGREASGFALISGGEASGFTGFGVAAASSKEQYGGNNGDKFFHSVVLSIRLFRLKHIELDAQLLEIAPEGIGDLVIDISPSFDGLMDELYADTRHKPATHR